MIRRVFVASIALLMSAGVATASWYDDYDAGIAAIRKGQWQAAVQSMSAAIQNKPKENNKERAYGTIFYNYHPYYYRGIAYLKIGQFEKAISDLERAEGMGEENLGSIETNLQTAKGKLAQETAAAQPQPQPVAPQPQPARPVPAPQPAAPVISSALRQQAAQAIGEADQARVKAQARNATASPSFTQAMNQLAGARTQALSAKSDDDLNAAIASAGNAKMFFDSATAPAVVAAAPPPAPAPKPVPRVTAATDATVGSTADRVRHALEAYFRGDFDDAAQRFQDLTRELPDNGWIFAFLGASQYSMYTFELDDTYRAQAMESFRKAKKLHFRNGELPQKYFSKRIRKVFRTVEG